jgi:hypothetical protein
VNQKEIEYLARAIVNRLEDRGLVEFTDAEAGIEAVSRALAGSLRTIEAAEAEVRERLARSGESREATEEEIDLALRQIVLDRGKSL